ncbi:DUF7427 family protein [Mycobacteroides abscessus]
MRSGSCEGTPRSSTRALPGKYMWAVIFGGVAYHDALCKDNDTLSEVVDRALEKHPVLVHVLVLVTAAHLLNWLPSQTDPYHLIGVLFKKSKGKHD